MSGSNRSAVVANIGVGLNGKLLRAVMHNKPGSVKYYLKCGGNPNVTTQVMTFNLIEKKIFLSLLSLAFNFMLASANPLLCKKVKKKVKFN